MASRATYMAPKQSIETKKHCMKQKKMRLNSLIEYQGS